MLVAAAYYMRHDAGYVDLETTEHVDPLPPLEAVQTRLYIPTEERRPPSASRLSDAMLHLEGLRTRTEGHISTRIIRLSNEAPTLRRVDAFAIWFASSIVTASIIFTVLWVID